MLRQFVKLVCIYLLLILRIVGLQRVFGLSHSFCVDRRGHSGHLVVFWANSIDVNILLFSSGHVDVQLSFSSDIYLF